MTVVRPNSIAGINSITVQTGQALNIHDASGNLIRNITSSSGVSTFTALHVGAGTTTSTQGISVGTGCSIVSTTVNQLELYTNSSERLKITSSGLITQSNTWTNTYSATDTTHCGYQVHNKSDTTNTYAALRLTAGTSSPATAQIASVRTGTGSNDITFQLEASNTAKEALRITSAGLVGINSATPNKQLTVQGLDVALRLKSTVATGRIGMEFYDTAAQKGFLGYPSSGHDNMSLQQNETADLYVDVAGSERLRIRADGRVAIASSLAVTGVCTAAAFITPNGNSNKRNLIDNGEFIVDQRMGGSATAITPSGGVDYTCDRWHSSNYGGEAGRITFQTVSGDVPNSNYRQSIKLDCTTAMGTPSGNNYMSFSQFTEAQDNRFLGHGTATAKPVTLQFWIKSTKTGTASVGLARHDASREYIAEYTINSTNTWEKKTITFPGDTSGTEMAMDNGRGFKLNFVLFAGSSRHATVNQWAAYTSSYYSASSNQVNLIDSTSNNIYFTGIQLEVGEVATPFEYKNYGDELSRCQRYYQEWTHGYCCGNSIGSSDIMLGVPLTVPLRAAPSIAAMDLHRSGNKTTTVSIVSVSYTEDSLVAVRVGSWTGGNAVSDENAYVVAPTNSTTMKLNAEM